MKILNLDELTKEEINNINGEVIEVEKLDDSDGLKILYILEQGNKIKDLKNNTLLELEISKIYKCIKSTNLETNKYSKQYLTLSKNENAESINDNYLVPLGSIIIVEGEKLLIISRGVAFENKTKYVDYVGVRHPIGLKGDELLRFNNEDIDEIIQLGLDDEENKEATLQIKEWLDTNNQVKKFKLNIQ